MRILNKLWVPMGIATGIAGCVGFCKIWVEILLNPEISLLESIVLCAILVTVGLALLTAMPIIGCAIKSVMKDDC